MNLSRSNVPLPQTRSNAVISGLSFLILRNILYQQRLFTWILLPVRLLTMERFLLKTWFMTQLELLLQALLFIMTLQVALPLLLLTRNIWIPPDGMIPLKWAWELPKLSRILMMAPCLVFLMLLATLWPILTQEWASFPIMNLTSCCFSY